MILGIHHVAVSVPDLDEAVRFYCDVLGFEAQWGSQYAEPSDNVDRAIGLSGVAADMKMLKAGNAYIELWRYHNPAPRPKDPAYPPSDHGLAHFCLQVEDIAAEHARLSAGGMTFVGPPVDFGQMSAVYGRDPFGNIVEIFEIRDNAAPGLTPERR
jgi:glyoxylase I family protein